MSILARREEAEPKKESGQGDLYEILGVGKDASEEEIKKAYRQKSLIKHPDRGGDKDEFKLIALAFEVLSDSDRKKAYDDGKGTEKENRTHSEIIALVHQLFVQAVVSDRKHPMAHVKSSIDKMRSDQKIELNRATQMKAKLEKRLRDFQGKNEKSTNQSSVSLLASFIRQEIQNAKTFIESSEEKIDLFTAALTLLNGVNEFPTEMETKGSWTFDGDQIGFRAFSQFGHNG